MSFVGALSSASVLFNKKPENAGLLAVTFVFGGLWVVCRLARRDYAYPGTLRSCLVSQIRVSGDAILKYHQPTQETTT